MVMKKKNLSQSQLFTFAGIIFIIAAIISMFSANKFMAISYVPLGICFIAIGVKNKNNRSDDK